MSWQNDDQSTSRFHVYICVQVREIIALSRHRLMQNKLADG